MNIGFFFARRYFFSGKSTNAINIISGISTLAFLVGSAALIIILSALNGFEGVITSMISSYDPHIKITSVAGKVFEPTHSMIKNIEAMNGVLKVSPTLEENAVITYHDAQEIVRIKGVEDDYGKSLGFDTLMVDGQFIIKGGETGMGVFGSGIASRLNVNPLLNISAKIFVPKRNASYNSLNPEESLNMATIFPAGVFSLQEDMEKDYVLVPIEMVRKMLDYPTRLSSLEVVLKDAKDMVKVKNQIADMLGNKFTVKDRFEQNDAIYKIFRSEKWATYLILFFILLVASFNMIGALTMLVLEKKKDVAVLKSLGFTNWKIRSIFLQEGLLLSVLGGIIGIGLGLFFCWLQLQFGFIKLENSIVESYPVKVLWEDVGLVLGTIIFLGLLTSFYPGVNSVKTEDVKLS
jgi:lipoprotein-releasing system permease protein